MKIERTITIFSNESETLLKEMNIDYIGLDKLEEIFEPTSKDPLMYDVYEIVRENAKMVNALLKEPMDFDFIRYSYYVECSQLPPYQFNITKRK